MPNRMTGQSGPGTMSLKTEDEPDKALAEEFDPESYYHANRKLKLSESVQMWIPIFVPAYPGKSIEA